MMVPKSRLIQIAVVAAVFVCSFFAGSWFRSRASPPAIDARMLRGSVPVALDMTLTAEDLESGDGIAMLHGDVEYRFTNISARPVKLAFPPARVFSFTSTGTDASWTTSSSTDETPEFAREQAVVELAPGEARVFSGTMSMSVPESYPDTGLGWSAFIFAPPLAAESHEGYCIGTLIPRFYVLHEGQRRQNQRLVVERDSNIAELRRVAPLSSQGEVEVFGNEPEEAANGQN